MTDYLFFSEVTIGSKDLGIGSVRLREKIFAKSNQASTSIDRQGHGDRYFPFRSRKNVSEIIIDFGQNVDEKL